MEKQIMDFNVIIEQDEDGIYVARAPEIEGCYTQGKNLQEVLERIKEAIEVCLEADKEEIISIGKKLGVDFKETTSCYIGKKEHCGFCLACRLRQEGFYWANIKDPTRYMKKMKDFRVAGE